MVEPQTTIVQQTLLVVIGIDFGMIEWKQIVWNKIYLNVLLIFFYSSVQVGILQYEDVWHHITFLYYFVDISRHDEPDCIFRNVFCLVIHYLMIRKEFMLLMHE